MERPYRFEVPGRVDYKRDVVQELNEDVVREIAGQIREKGVKAVAICYFFLKSLRLLCAPRDIICSSSAY